MRHRERANQRLRTIKLAPKSCWVSQVKDVIVLRMHFAMSGLKQPIVLPGSVASIKALELVENLARFANVRVLTTQKGAHFFDKDAIERTTGVQVFTDEDEWALWNGRGTSHLRSLHSRRMLVGAVLTHPMVVGL